ncbi:phosphoadenosine phosphosulfate reductase family protein (plasmid) [Streptomyces sp. NBC_00536]|uniref:phosphoadenosine phosphosulfate reductase domain-containing protein n=1 Tax=Streptomyces sp. NBC_00536 TaxID=2975769 RepID=UPI002E81333C|nr:phosphoadenosine phosphosulfate reductase family protein [Streptomyces sp. NBC_00536]WUC84515.1 phosphoadenosine phosphosulfate reductase family protein [Streptomyces sp. NBC_00536]
MPKPLPPCASSCTAAQLALFAPPAATPAAPAAEFDWDRQHVVVIGDSGGKDSGATVHTVCRAAEEAGQLHKVRVLHCDLGSTPGGHSIEWPGAADVARRRAAAYGVPFAVRRSTRWPSLWERILSHGRWPGHFARFCTSDTKTAVGRVYIDELAAELRLGEPIRAGYAMGMRAEESKARAQKPVIERHRMSGKGTLRIVTTWLPIQQLTTAEVWQLHEEHGIERHEAYDRGMRRLSCRACPLAKTEDLVRSAQLNPELFAEYAEAEVQMGDQFKKSISLREIIERARS